MTVLFADMVESTALGERLDPEALRAIQVRYFGSVREVVERHGGVVEKYIGDAVMAVFGVPMVHEDDALRAVRAASELGASLASLGQDLQRRRGVHLELRIGVHTGPVVVTDGDGAGTLVTGDTVNTAARLQQAAEPGQTLLGASTFDLVRDAIDARALEPMALKGKAADVPAYRLQAITGTEGRARRADTPLVGRYVEIDHLQAMFQAAVAERAPRLVTVLGAAGVGKSRLVREFAAAVSGRAMVVRGRCLSYGDGITYWSVVEILRAVAEITESDDPVAIHVRLADLVGDTAGSERLVAVLEAIVGASEATTVGDDVSWAVRRVFEAVARRGPLVVIVEDIHWAEPELLDLLEAVVDWTSDAALLVVCLARAEVVEERPTWGSGVRASNLALEPLGASSAGDLLRVLPGGAAIPTMVRERVVGVAEGNPLYLEEIVAKLVEDGALIEGDQGWAWDGDPGQVEIPATVQALVAARIDGLAPLEQRVAERASVVGRVFERGAVTALTPDGGGSVGAPLLALIRKQLVRPDGSGLDGDDAFCFRHIIIRDVAYERLPKAERAELHERFADWLESVLGDRSGEYIDILAHHYAEAVAYRVELDSLDGAGSGRLVERAVARLIEAAERAERLHVYNQAARLFDRAAATAGAETDGVLADPVMIVDLKRRAADAHGFAGDIAVAFEQIRGLLAAGGESDPVLRGTLLDRFAEYAWEVGDEQGALEAIEEATDLIPADPPTLERARVLAGRARFLMLLRRYEESVAVSREALDIAIRLGASVFQVHALTTLGTSLGSLDHEQEGVTLLEEARDLAVEIGDGPGFLRAGNNLGVTIRDRDRSDEAMIVAIDKLPELGLERSPAGIRLIGNLVNGLLHAGRLDEGERLLNRVLDLDPTGDDAIDLLTKRAYLMILRGRLPEARVALAVARDRASRGVQRVTHGDLCWTEAFVALFDGRYDEASRLVEEGQEFSGVSAADPAVESEWLQLMISVERALAARSTRDATAERDAVNDARDRVARSRALVAEAGEMMNWMHRHSLPLLGPELSRAEGRPDPAGWQAAAAELRADRFLWDEAYALFRGAEALLDVGAPRAEIAEAIDAAGAAAAAIGADGILKRSTDLRERAAR